MRLSQLAYEKYYEVVGGVSYDGRKMPTWNELKSDRDRVNHKIAWIHVSSSIRDAVLKECMCVVESRLSTLKDNQIHTSAQDACNDIKEDIRDVLMKTWSQEISVSWARDEILEIINNIKTGRKFPI